MYKVQFSFEQNKSVVVPLILAEPGQSILELALKNKIELNHECGGVCACTTCHIYVERGMECLDKMNKREKDFLERARYPRPGSRLGCQSLLLEGRGEIDILLPQIEQAY